MEYMYSCYRCGNIFRSSVDTGKPANDYPECPLCGSSSVKKLPSWAPLGSNISEDIPEWEYECQSCQERFKLPIPGSPSEARCVICPTCQGRHIHRLTATGFEPLYCG